MIFILKTILAAVAAQDFGRETKMVSKAAPSASLMLHTYGREDSWVFKKCKQAWPGHHDPLMIPFLEDGPYELQNLLTSWG